MNSELKNLYESDGYAWFLTNAKLLKNRKFNEIDLENLVEEIESMGKYHESKLESFMIQLFLHLLKWEFQDKKRTRSWKVSIEKQRMNIEKHLEENPSLKGHLDRIVKTAYRYARKSAALETALPIKTFPEQMSFSLEDALTEYWVP